MSKTFAKPLSRTELLSLSREELVDIILQETPPQPPSWVFSDDYTTEIEKEEPEQRYNAFCRQVAENFPNGAVAVLDRELTYLYVTGQELKRRGLDSEAFIGQKIGVVTSGNEAQSIREKLQTVFDGKPCNMEVVVGEETYFISAIPLPSEDGSIDQLLTVSQNISERQNALRQAQESEIQFRTLAENIPGAVYIMTNDAERRMIYLSGNVENLCGYSTEEFLTGKIDSRQLMHEDDRQSAKAILKEATDNNRPYHLVYRWHHKEQYDCWIEEYGASIVKDHQQYFLGVLFDISEKKKYEKELQQQNEDLKKVNAELDHFAYSVSHDLRAPLTSAIGLLRLLKDEEDKSQRDYFTGIVQQSLAKLDNYIQEIIQLTKNARTDLIINTINLESMISEVVSSQKQTADEDRIEISTEVDQSTDFSTDARRLWIVLNNLVSNAIRYYFSLREHSYVRIIARVEQDELLLVVEDNGIGIQQQHLDKIFDMFYRANDRTAGSGLGLYLVKETVARLKGSVAVQSEYERGTTFTVRLPSLTTKVLQ